MDDATHRSATRGILPIMTLPPFAALDRAQPRNPYERPHVCGVGVDRAGFPLHGGWAGGFTSWTDVRDVLFDEWAVVLDATHGSTIACQNGHLVVDDFPPPWRLLRRRALRQNGFRAVPFAPDHLWLPAPPPVPEEASTPARLDRQAEQDLERADAALLVLRKVFRTALADVQVYRLHSEEDGFQLAYG